MAIPFLNDIEVTGDIVQKSGTGNLDIEKNELRQAVIQNLASEPMSPSAGQVIHNTAKTDAVKGNGKLGYRTASSWVYPDMEKSTYDTNNNGKVDVAENSELLGSKDSAYHLARANHTGSQTSSTISDFEEAAQDAVADALIDTNSIDFTYNDVANTIKADLRLNGADLRVGAGGVDLNTSGVTAGTYTKVGVNSKGIVTSGTTLTSGDLPAHTHTAAQVTDLASVVKAYKLNEFAAPTSDVSLNSKKITNLADPVAGTDAANKNYVDNAVAGLNWKASVKATTTANITLSGNQTIDGVSITAGMRVLVKDQSLAKNNGIYISASGAWTRASDANTWDSLVSAAVFVEQGTTQADTAWTCTVDAGGTIGTTNVTWTQFTGAATIIAGDALYKNGNTLNVKADGNSIQISSDFLQLKLAPGGGINFNNGGVFVVPDNVTIELDGGQLKLKSAFQRAKHTQQITGNNSSSTFTINHGMGTKDVIVNVYEDTTGYSVYPLIERTTSTAVNIHFKVAPVTNKKYNVVIIG